MTNNLKTSPPKPGSPSLSVITAEVGAPTLGIVENAEEPAKPAEPAKVEQKKPE